MCRGALTDIGEGFRLLALVILKLAATWLPRSWALGLAGVVGRILAATPIGARAAGSLRSAFRLSGSRTRRLAREWLTRPFRDYVTAGRVVAQRDLPECWTVTQRGAHAMLREPGRSFIVATGHFSRQAMTGVYLPSVVSKRLITVVAPIDRRSHSLKALRVRLQLGEMMKGIQRIRGGDADFVEVGEPGAVSHLIRHLRQPGSAVVIAVDAPWPKGRAGGYERPFAGFASQNFALGAARLSRISQCPIITCVPFLNDDDTLVLEWGEPIFPATSGDQTSDMHTTDLILDEFDRAIGRRPGQYVLPIGDERRWHPVIERWIAAPRRRMRLAQPVAHTAAPAARPAEADQRGVHFD